VEDLATFLEQDIVGVIMQYLREKGYTESARKCALFAPSFRFRCLPLASFLSPRLEQEAKYRFDIQHFKNMFIEGQWKELFAYLSSFLKPDRSLDHSLIYFELLKQKYFDALDRSEYYKLLAYIIFIYL